MHLYTIYTTLCIAYDFARNQQSASTCIRYAPTRIYMQLYVLYALHVIIYGTHVLCLHLHVSHMRIHVLILISNYMHYIRTYMYYMHTQLNVQLVQPHVYYLCDMRTCITFAYTRINKKLHALHMHLYVYICSCT